MTGHSGRGPLPGQFGNQTKVGTTHSRQASPEKKAYSKAVRELFDAKHEDRFPQEWGPRPGWTNAQELVERHFVLALAGSEQHAKLLIDRAEGRVPMAPEDRESQEKQAASLGAGMTALQQLQLALGLIREVPITVEAIDLPALPAKGE